MARGSVIESSLSPDAGNLDPVDDDIGRHDDRLPEDEFNEVDPPEPPRESDADRRSREAHEDAVRRARVKGWRSPEEWTGGSPPPGGFKTAEEFLARGESDNGLLRRDLQRANERNDALERKVTEASNSLSEMQRGLAELRESAKKADQEGYARAKRELLAERRTAAANGDLAGVMDVTERIDALDEQRVIQRTEAPPPPPPREEPRPQPQVQLAPAVQDFVNDNPWYGRDVVLSEAMAAEHKILLAQSPAMPLDENLARAKQLVMDRFPEKFGLDPNRQPPARPRRPGPSTPTGGGGGNPPPRKTGIDVIEDPAERADMRAGFESARRSMPDMTEAMYIRLYNDPKADVLQLQDEERRRAANSGRRNRG